MTAGAVQPARIPPFAAEHGSLLDGRIFTGLLILLLAMSGFVINEPAPYDIMAVIVMVLFVSARLPIVPGIGPLILAVILFVASGFLAATQAADLGDALFYVAVTGFLAVNAVFFALVVVRNPVGSVRAIVTGYLIAAAITSICAIVGYFDLLPFSEQFLRYGRAKALFEDPNVMGPFLIIPALFLVARILRSRSVRTGADMALLFLFLSAIFLSFSRGAWGHLIVSVAMLICLQFITSRTNAVRVRILLAVAAGFLVTIVFLAWIASIEEVRTLLIQRAKFTQDYDVGSTGRFARHAMGLIELAWRPLGLGPREFGKLFGEDPHNVFLKAFSAYGWLAGVAYLSLVLTTLWAGFRHAFRRTPWQSQFQVVYAGFFGLVLLSLIIDTDRWRHFWLLLGMVWGMMAAEPARHSQDSVGLKQRGD